MNPWLGVIRWWIGWLAGTVLAGMALSIFSGMAYCGYTSLLWGALWGGWLLAASPRGGPPGARARWNALLPPWPIALIWLLSLASWLLGMGAVLDSFAYRIPQMLFWLQEGHPVWVDHAADARLNGMPHVWSFISAPCYLLLGERALAFPSWASLAILYGSLCLWAGVLGVSEQKGRWIASIFGCSVGFGLQAISTENTLFIAALLAAASALCARQETDDDGRGRMDVLLSLFAVALASGTKPQYAIVGAIWLAWFFLAPSGPWRRLAPAHWPVAAILATLLSFVPTWAATRLHGGHFGGMEKGLQAFQPGFWKDLLASLGSLVVQVFAPPVNPLHGPMTAALQRLAASLNIPANQATALVIPPIAIVDSASLGLVAGAALVAGCVLGFRHSPPRGLSLLALAALALGFAALALSRPTSGGRSWLGFLALLFPLGLWGLAFLQTRWLAAWASLSALGTGLAILLTPTHPLLPIVALKPFMNTDAHAKTAARYSDFAQRAIAGSDLIALLPEGTTDLCVIADQQTPLTPLWRGHATRVRFVDPELKTLRDAVPPGARFILVRSAYFPDNAETYRRLQTLGFSLLAKSWWITFLRRGYEPWMLFERDKVRTEVIGR